MFGLSPIQMLICGVVAVLLFGSRLPSVAKSLGKSLTEFRRGMQDMQSEFRDAMNDAEQAARTPAEGTQARIASSVEPEAAPYDDAFDEQEDYAPSDEADQPGTTSDDRTQQPTN